MKTIFRTLALVILTVVISTSSFANNGQPNEDINIKISKSTENSGIYTLNVLGLEKETEVNVVLKSKSGKIIFDSKVTLIDASDEIDVLTANCESGAYIISVKGEGFEKTAEFAVDIQL